MPNVKIHTGRPNTRPAPPAAEPARPIKVDFGDESLREDVFLPTPPNRQLMDDNLLNVGRSGRIVGPLAFAAATSGGCDWRYGVSSVIIGVLAGLATYLLISMRKPKSVELPSYLQMYSRGIEDSLWQSYLRKLVRLSPNPSLRVRKNKLFTREGTEVSLMQYAVRKRLLKLSHEEDKRAIFAAASRSYAPPLDSFDLPETIEHLEHIAYTVNPAFKAGSIMQMEASKFLELSPHCIELLDGLHCYNQVIPELADIYEPTLLAQYYTKCEYEEEAQVMLDLAAHCLESIRTHHIVSLFREIPDMQMLERGEKANLRVRPSQKIDLEGNIVASIVHMYFARTINDNVMTKEAQGIAQRHVEATDLLLGADYSGAIASAMDRGFMRKPSIRCVELPTLAGRSASWKINLASMTLSQLRLR